MPTGRAIRSTLLAINRDVDTSKAQKAWSSPPLVPTASSRPPSGEKASAQIERVKHGCGVDPPNPPESALPSAAEDQPNLCTSRSVSTAQSEAYAAVPPCALPIWAVATSLWLGCKAQHVTSCVWPSYARCTPPARSAEIDPDAPRSSEITASRPAG